jgi:hypothetical protein
MPNAGSITAVALAGMRPDHGSDAVIIVHSGPPFIEGSEWAYLLETESPRTAGIRHQARGY